MKLTGPKARAEAAEHVRVLLAERTTLMAGLKRSALVRHVWPSDANYLLVECKDADKVLAAVKAVKLIVRDQRAQPLLPGCLRISVGTPEQNQRLLAALAAAGA